METNSQILCTKCHATKTLKEERERQDQLFDARQRAIADAKAAAPSADAAPVTKKPRVPKPNDPDFIDALTHQNPFLMYAFEPVYTRRGKIM